MNLKYLYHLFPGVLKGVRALGRVRTEGEVSPCHRREYKIIKVHKKNLSDTSNLEVSRDYFPPLPLLLPLPLHILHKSSEFCCEIQPNVRMCIEYSTDYMIKYTSKSDKQISKK